MGIPRFYGDWIRNKDYKGLLQKGLPPQVSSLSIDMNSLIHDCAQLVYAYGNYADATRAKLVSTADPRYLETELHQAIGTKIMEIYSQVRPADVLCLAVDGVAPRAKVNQQRQRRYRAGQKPQSGIFDTNSITPGTDFMIRLDNFLQRWLYTNQTTLPPKIIYSNHKVPGEGEHKVFDLMRSGIIPDNGAHVLHGLDADLFMLSMVAPFDNIYLIRDKNRQIVSISALKRGINGELGTISGYSDFVLMLYLVGNDFLPVQPSLEELAQSVDLLMNVYKELRKEGDFNGLTKGNEIDWEGLAKYITKLGEMEPAMLGNVAQKDFRFRYRVMEKATSIVQEIGKPVRKIFDAATFRAAWYENALGPKGDITEATKLLAGEAPYQITQDRIVEMCLNYMTGLAWTFLYYKQGTEAVNASYLYRYYHTPLFSDLAIIVNAYKGNYLNPYIATDENRMFGIPEQLLAVLPPKSKELLPYELQPLMATNSIIHDMFPSDFLIEMDGKSEEHHGIVLLPPVEPERIFNAVNAVVWTPERALLFEQGDNIIIERDLDINEAMRRKAQFEERLRETRPQTFRGRGRGRGDFVRGRGDFTRGRGGFTRGRGRGGVPQTGEGVFYTEYAGPGTEIQTAQRQPYRGRGGTYRGRGTQGQSRRDDLTPGMTTPMTEARPAWMRAEFLQ